MKKIISLLLVAVITLICVGFVGGSFVAEAASFKTENGVQVEMAKFLYKSTLYKMEFPSHQSYNIKETSIEGDYAISRELNDLSYTFVFPAGTTEIKCQVSLDGETDWRGFSVNAVENPNYWVKDSNGNIDYSKPLTFRRIEEVAEQDEYGVLYRDFLKDKNVKGFRDFDRIYWQLSYICNGEYFTESFSIKLYDYDASEKMLLRAVNFNVAGLPFTALSGTDVAANQSAAAKYLSDNSFDIAAVQEDFGYHQDLVKSLKGFNYMTNHTGTIPGGDGLNIFTKEMPVYNETRVAWNDAYGILSDGSDELTPKGFVYIVIDIGNGIYVDFYNLHADAYGGAGSVAARTSQYKQLAEFIEARSKENDRPVIVAGDFNNHLHAQEDNAALYNIFCVQNGFKDAWVEFHNNGNYFDMHSWYLTGLPSWGNWDSVERFMYRSGGGVDIVVSDFRYVNVSGDNGALISDHAAVECDFTVIKTEDFVENTQELKVVTSGNSFMHRIIWFFKALFLILSDIDNISELLNELA